MAGRDASRSQRAARSGGGSDPLAFPQVAVGKKVPIPDLALPASAKGDVLLAVCAECASCTVSVINPPKIDPSSYAEVILAFASPREDIPKAYLRLGPKVKVVADSDGRWLRQAGLSPDARFYLLSSDLRIIDAQRTVAKVPDFVRRRP